MDQIFSSRQLTKRYRDNTVVDRVDMTVARGDIYGFVGANGAGKTTLIRLICGLANPSDGDFSLFGVGSGSRDITAARRRISAIVEAPALHSNMSASDNFILQCRILGISPSGYPELMDCVGLSDMKASKRKAGNYSLGMKQRLGIALALTGGPEFIILDEPLNGLDPQGIIDIRALIIRLNREGGITFLISSHILRELSLVATKYGFISKGKLLKEISAGELHAECRRSVDIELSDPAAAAACLKGSLGLTDMTTDASLLRVYDDINVGRLVSALNEGGFEVRRIVNREDDLEEYYLKLTGGDANG